jgi:hypothetical protein
MRVPGFIALFALAAVTLVAQGPPPGQPTPGQPTPGQPTSPGQRTPPRGAPPRPGETAPTGTAVFRGQVVSADGTPLRRAQVRAVSQDARSGSMTSTDAQGRFEMTQLPAGRYTVTASKAGFVTMQFGQRRADQPGSGTILDVLDNQLVERIQFVLPRGGVVTGRVLDEFGDPIAGVQVSAQRYRFVAGARRLTPSGGDMTDDQGGFRIYGLAPGDYYVSGTLRSQMVSMPNITSSDVEGFAPSYYPGTANLAEAQRISVKGGQELSGINFALMAARLARVRGRVTTSAGEAPGAPLMVMVSARDPSQAMSMMMSSAQTRGDGTFQLVGLAPGSYNVTARPMGMPGPRQEVGQARLTVTNEDVDNFLIVMSTGATARGIITTDEGTPLPMTPQAVRLFANPADPNPGFLVGAPSMPTVHDDWTFEMSGLFDRRFIRASLAEMGDWFLKGVYYRDQDVTDTPLEFVPGQSLEGLQVVFTRKVTEVTGLVRDDKGQAVLDSSIVIFPGEAERWTYQSRYIRTARVDQEGRYRLRNLPPHDDYRLVAVRELEEGRWSDPEFLESVRETAARVTLDEGQTAVQDLKVQQVPEP